MLDAIMVKPGSAVKLGDALAATSTKSAPWYVIPADRNWVRNFAVTTVLIHALRKLDPQFPVLSR